LLPGGAKGAPKFELIHPAHLPKGLLIEDPARAHLRVDGGFVLGSEGAVGVAPDRACQKDPVPPRQLLLGIEALGGILLVRLGAGGGRPARDRGDGERREILAKRGDAAALPPAVLQSDGRREGESW